MYDVIVVGAGPAGSLAAKKCAEQGLGVLLLEKSALPRDKVCSGMVMGVMAQELVRQEFGEIPYESLTNPSHLAGFLLYVPETEPQVLEYRMPFAWRRDLDFWMTQQARQAGADIRDGVKVVSVEPESGHCVVRLGQETIESRFVIGADGANSTIRRSIHPELNITYRTAYRECYSGELALDRNYFHWFAPLSRTSPRFSLCHKGEFFLLGGALKQLRSEANKILGSYGFSGRERPIWKDGCISGAGVNLKGGLYSGAFIPARDNILLVGDAALLQMPVSWDGIGMALKSSLHAVESIVDALATGRDVGEIYLPRFASLLDILKDLDLLGARIEEAGKQGRKALAAAWADGIKAALSIA
ncbi:MAG: NAD(P)/FAD-dependent oxidoreductase [Chloroflexi bacterium]|nr:NAD(P)/FAD-dependent oxidoreductase [Chloroflexota bacterium]